MCQGENVAEAVPGPRHNGTQQSSECSFSEVPVGYLVLLPKPELGLTCKDLGDISIVLLVPARQPLLPLCRFFISHVAGFFCPVEVSSPGLLALPGPPKMSHTALAHAQEGEGPGAAWVGLTPRKSPPQQDHLHTGAGPGHRRPSLRLPAPIWDSPW